jgi:hypothetical protein
MINVTPVEGDAERWLRQSVRVYLEGDNNFHWISRVVRGSENPTAILLLTTFGRFNRTARYRRLLKSVRESARKSGPHTVWVLHSSPT